MTHCNSCYPSAIIKLSWSDDRIDFLYLKSRCFFFTYLSHTVGAPFCPFYFWTSSRAALYINVYVSGLTQLKNDPEFTVSVADVLTIRSPTSISGIVQETTSLLISSLTRYKPSYTSHVTFGCCYLGLPILVRMGSMVRLRPYLWWRFSNQTA